MRSAFEAQGEYFRAYDDAGFVADSAELLALYRRLDACDLEAVALFHVHRRQPANFSVIDFRLHNPAYAWHLIISLRNPAHPVLRAFAVRKGLASDFGISAEDHNEGSEDLRRAGGQSAAARRRHRGCQGRRSTPGRRSCPWVADRGRNGATVHRYPGSGVLGSAPGDRNHATPATNQAVHVHGRLSWACLRG
jgi:hypothetical protein